MTEKIAVKAIRNIIKGMVSHNQYNDVHTELKTATRLLKYTPNKAQKIVKRFIKKSNWFIVQKKQGKDAISLKMSAIAEFEYFLECEMNEAIGIVNSKI